MKKILLIACLVAFGKNVFAHGGNGGLTIMNTSSSCGITVTMYALAPSLGGTGNCSELVSNVFNVAAGATVSWSSDMLFSGSVGWSYSPAPLTAGTLDFQWSSAYFTSSCTPACIPTATWRTIADGYACQGANLVCGDGCITLSWSSPFYGYGLADVTIQAY